MPETTTDNWQERIVVTPEVAGARAALYEDNQVDAKALEAMGDRGEIPLAKTDRFDPALIEVGTLEDGNTFITLGFDLMAEDDNGVAKYTGRFFISRISGASPDGSYDLIAHNEREIKTENIFIFIPISPSIYQQPSDIDDWLVVEKIRTDIQNCVRQVGINIDSI